MQTIGLVIGGMHCQACVRRVTAALGKVAGVKVDEVTIGGARVTFDPAATSVDAIVGAVNAQGFEATAG